MNAHIKIQPDFFTSPAESEKYFYTRKIRLIDVFTVGNRIGRCSFHVGLQLDHLNGRRCRFIALVPVFSARPVECLLLVVHRQDAECYRHIPLYLQLGDTLCHALADEIEMAGFTLNDAAQSDHRIHVRIFGEKLGPESQLESAGDIFDLNIQVAASGAAEGLDRSFEQGFRDFPG